MGNSNHGAASRRYLPSFAILRSFESAARHENFTKAAEELSLTQGAISRQIGELEAAIGVSLFRRVGRRVLLTDAGKAFADELSIDLERIQQTIFRAIAAGNGESAVRIATLPTFASRWLIPRLKDFERVHPAIQVSCFARLEPFDLAREHFDLALHFGAANWPDAQMRRLFGETMMPVASPEFVQHHAISGAAALIRAPLLHLKTRAGAWNDWFTLVGLDTPGALHGKQFDHFSMIISAAVSSLGAALLPSYLIERELNEGLLVTLNEQSLKTNNAYYVVRPAGAPLPHVQHFIDWLVNATKVMRDTTI